MKPVKVRTQVTLVDKETDCKLSGEEPHEEGAEELETDVELRLYVPELVYARHEEDVPKEVKNDQPKESRVHMIVNSHDTWLPASVGHEAHVHCVGRNILKQVHLFVVVIYGKGNKDDYRDDKEKAQENGADLEHAWLHDPFEPALWLPLVAEVELLRLEDRVDADCPREVWDYSHRFED